MKCLVLPSDDIVTVTRKKCTVILLLFVICILGFNIPLTFSDNEISLYSAIFGLAVSILSLTFIVWSKTCPSLLFEGLMIYFCGMACLTDMMSHLIYSVRIWPMVVILLDLLLVGRSSTAAPRVVLVLTSLYLIVMCVEHTFRFGLFDLFGDYEDRRIDCDCEHPPCSRVHSWNELIIAVVVFYFDFYITRGFADAVLVQKAKVDASITTANIIASALANYDLESAEEALNIKGAELPVELYMCYLSILRNLEVYKPYLPRSCLFKEVERNPTCETHVEDKVITMSHTVANFTDSESSTNVVPMPSDCSSAVASHFGKTADMRAKSIKVDMKKSNVTLITINITNSLTLVKDHFIDFSRLHRTYVLSSLAAFDSHKGVTDLFSGDKLYISFNASRLCYAHATAAVSSVTRFKELMEKCDHDVKLSIGISKGEVIHGDLGCDSMRRFSVIGKLPILNNVLERFSSRFGIECACDAAMEIDVGMTHELRLVLQRISVSPNLMSKPLLVYELILSAQKGQSVPAMEWMYLLEKGGGKKWEQFNDGAKMFLLNDIPAAEKILRLASDDCSKELIKRIEEGLSPPPPLFYGFQESDPDSLNIVKLIT